MKERDSNRTNIRPVDALPDNVFESSDISCSDLDRTSLGLTISHVDDSDIDPPGTHDSSMENVHDLLGYELTSDEEPVDHPRSVDGSSLGDPHIFSRGLDSLSILSTGSHMMTEDTDKPGDSRYSAYVESESSDSDTDP